MDYIMVGNPTYVHGGGFYKFLIYMIQAIYRITLNFWFIYTLAIDEKKNEKKRQEAVETREVGSLSD